MSRSAAENAALLDVQDGLRECGKSLADFPNMPIPHEAPAAPNALPCFVRNISQGLVQNPLKGNRYDPLQLPKCRQTATDG